MLSLLGIPLGLLYGNLGEWILHNYVLHGIGKGKTSRFRFHWHSHHRNARKNDMYDPEYERTVFEEGHPKSEFISLIILCVAHLPLLFFFPVFSLTIYYCAINYYRMHKKSHLDVEWGKRNMPWHYDHHMGPNQDSNWGVTKPWFDYVLGTREPYLGTEKEEELKRRKEAKRKRESLSQAGGLAVN